MADFWQSILRVIFANRHYISYFVMIKVLRVAVASAIILGTILLLRCLFRRWKSGREELCYPLWAFLMTAPVFVRYQGFGNALAGADYLPGHVADNSLLSRAADSKIVLSVYLAGVMFAIASSVRHSHKLKAKIRAMSDMGGNSIWEEAKKLTGARQARCVLSDCNTTPYSFGIRRPVVALPSDYCERYREEELKMVLCHELLHIQSRDLVFLKLYEVFRCLFWFNPVVWAGGKCLKQDMECYNDYRMLHVLKADAGHYGNAILRSLSCHPLCGMAQRQAAASLADEKKNLLIRFQYIAGAKTVCKKARKRFYFVMAVLAAVGTIYVLNHSHRAFTEVNSVLGVAPPMSDKPMSEQDMEDAYLLGEEETQKVAWMTGGRVTIYGRELDQRLKAAGYKGDKVMLDLYFYNKEQRYTVSGSVTLDRCELDKDVLELPLAEKAGERLMNKFLKYI